MGVDLPEEGLSDFTCSRRIGARRKEGDRDDKRREEATDDRSASDFSLAVDGDYGRRGYRCGTFAWHRSR